MKKTTKAAITKKIAPVSKKSKVVKKAASQKTTKLSSAVTNHIIPKSLGLEMVKRFKDNLKNLNKVTFELGKEFDKSLFEELLKLKGLKNVRIYNALNKDNGHTFIITGLDKNSNELYFKIKNSSKSNGIIQEKIITNTTAEEDGVGNMGNQCTEPPLRSINVFYKS